MNYTALKLLKADKLQLEITVTSFARKQEELILRSSTANVIKNSTD